jgi:hypothetical protein
VSKSACSKKAAHGPFFWEPNGKERVASIAVLGGVGMRADEYQAKEIEYRNYAAELVQLADETPHAHERVKLLDMAVAWTNLAARMKELAEGNK